MDISEEDHDVSVDGAANVDAAEKADGIMDSFIRTYVDITAELNGVFHCVSGSGSDEDCADGQEADEEARGNGK
jgi:hypothetical protein